MKYNARRDRLVVCYCLNDLFEIYRADGSLHRRVYAPGSHLFDTSRIQSDKLGVPLPEMTFTFEECCLTDECIYLLYNGAGSFLDKSVPTRIYVFDYDGNPVKYYVLDRKMRSFCVDDRGETLYALADGDDGKQVVRYAL